MTLKDVEISMAKHLSVARKAIINAGANKSQVRIMGDLITCKMHAKYNELEEMLSSPNRRRSYTRRQAVPSNLLPVDSHTEVISAKLSECPCCGTRFYMAKGPQ